MSERISRRETLGGIAAGTVAGLAGCAEGVADEDDDEQAFTIVPHMDPTGSGDDWERWGGMTPYWTRVVEPLVWGTEEMQPEPWLATDWEATSETTWVFELREDVVFHNGEEMTADDVVHSFEDDILTEYGDYVYGWLHLEPGSVEKVDDYTVEFENTEPFSGFPGTIAHNMIDIHPPSADPWNGDVVGSGPFILESVDGGQSLELGVHEEYWGGEPNPNGLTFRAAEDATTRTNLLESGDADVVFDPAKSRVSSLRDDEDVEVHTQQSPGSYFLAVNLYREPTDDATLRRALSYAVSQEEIVDSVLEGLGLPAAGPISTVIDWAGDDNDLPSYEQDFDAAAELVEESAYGGEALTCLVRNDMDDGELIAQVLEANFEEIGVEIDVEVLESASYQDRTNRGEFHLDLAGSQSNSPAADYIMWENFHSEGVHNVDLYEAEGTGVHNLGGEVDELIETAFRSTDPDEKREAYVEAQVRLLEESVVVPLCYLEDVVAADAALEGIDLHPIDRFADWRELER
ncbi:ABC transporter substrate-binding protein [Natronococcus sp.]|uniref:ABC transporter substrate-binding protein n=1 Tax=Natronococcus sp. TaxID=35747 RepID=UPI0025FCDBBA|nr:ABC transporter substrate-binding protein [Natronococcus sp.]